MNATRRFPRSLALMALMALAIAFATGACAIGSAEDNVPAVLTANAASHAELVKIVQQALHRTDITLADDALTRESELVIGPVQPRDAQGRYLNGRALGKPDHFRLVMHGSVCVLVHVETDERWAMHKASCVRKRVGA